MGRRLRRAGRWLLDQVGEIGVLEQADDSAGPQHRDRVVRRRLEKLQRVTLDRRVGGYRRGRRARTSALRSLRR